MKWEIPAKTFLLGEYAALKGESALLLTTSPCFQLSIAKKGHKQGIHRDSPAGKWWHQYKKGNDNLQWEDPYHGLGGLGASSAQFIGAYCASLKLNQNAVDEEKILEAYYQSAWNEEGIKPSGYDVLAQLQPADCGVYIHKNAQIIRTMPWPFRDLSFILLHTRKKLATHLHLASTSILPETQTLAALAEQGYKAFHEADSRLFTHTINACYHELQKLQLVAAHTEQCITALKKYESILALKGCGALGADVLFLLVKSEEQETTAISLAEAGYWVITPTLHKNIPKNT